MKKELEIQRYDLTRPMEVTKMAVVLKKHIIDNQLFTKIRDKNYVHVDGWVFAGGLLGLLPRIEEVSDHSNEKEIKWHAKAVIINQKTGDIAATGYALCSNKEDKKKSFDEYAILSMAQTRAVGKAYRNLIGWVIGMSGYESTPAEEVSTSEAELNSMVEKASKVIATASTIDALMNMDEKIQGSKKYTAEQKKQLHDLINQRTDQLQEMPAK